VIIYKGANDSSCNRGVAYTAGVIIAGGLLSVGDQNLTIGDDVGP
jgi:hypothetical protein